MWKVCSGFFSLHCFDACNVFLWFTWYSAVPIQYQAWWKDQYRENSFTDDKEVETLFNKKSNNSHGNSITTQVAWERNMFYQSHLSLILVTEDCRLPPRLLNPLRPHSPLSLTLQRKAAAWTCEMLNLMFAGAAMWQEGFFYVFISDPPTPYHVFASNCQNNMQGQSSVMPRKHVHRVPSVNRLF